MTAVRFHDEAIDAFGRLRVSNPVTLFDSKLLYDKAPLFWDESETDVSGNAASAHVAADSLVTMYVEAGDSIIRQTRQRFLYHPGKSEMVVMTGILTAGGTNVTGIMGLYDGTDGLFFRMNGTTAQVCKSKGGSVTAVSQSSWNLDPMDGSGPSEVNIDWSKVQVFLIDFEWLSAGRVRFGFFIDGRPTYCHEFTHRGETGGDEALEAPYMATPNLPIRYSIASGAGGASVTMKAICSTVMSEGGSPDLGAVTRISTNGVHINANTDGTRYPILGLRLSTSYKDQILNVEDVSLINEQSGDFEWFLAMNYNTATNSSKITWSTSTNGNYQIAAGSSSISFASTDKFELEIVGGYVKSANQGGGSANVHGETVIRPGIKLDGTRDEFWLVARPLAANADFQGTMQVRSLV